MDVPPSPVIVVDDDDGVCRSLKFSLQVEGLMVLTYTSGPEMLADPVAFEGGCLVVDHHMPVMTGVELLEELRRRRITIPAILITAEPAAKMRLIAARSDFYSILEKPFLEDALIDHIRAIFSSKQSLLPTA